MASPNTNDDINADDPLSSSSSSSSSGRRYMFTTNHTVSSEAFPALNEEKLTIAFQRLGVTVTLADAVIPMRDFHRCESRRQCVR